MAVKHSDIAIARLQSLTTCLNPHTVRRLFSRAKNFAQRSLFCGNYFQGLRAPTHMIMINSCIYVIFWLNNFCVKQKILEIRKNCGL